MKTKANEAAGVPFTLPRNKYTYTNDWLPIVERIDRAVEGKDVIDFIANEDPRTKIKLADGTMADYIPTKRIAIPVNKDNVLKAGIVKPEDEHLIVDTVYISLQKSNIDKSEMMMIDMLANFDWKRPIEFTQVYMLQDLGLLNYLQFDGYAYRLVPIYTPYESSWDIGRIDPDYAADLLLNKLRYGNLNNEKVYSDYFIQYNLNASRARSAFARVAKEFIKRGDNAKAVELLDSGLEKLPTSQLRYTSANTYPFLEGYYAAKAYDKGDALLKAYATNLMEYIDYYWEFTGKQGELVSDLIDDNIKDLTQIYYLAGYANRRELVAWMNQYFLSLGFSKEELIDVGDFEVKEDSLNIATTATTTKEVK